METKFVILLAVCLTYLRISNGVRLTNPCPANKPEVGCQSTTFCRPCQQYPNAQCYEDHCGQCKSRYFVSHVEVTSSCNAEGTIACVNGDQRQQCQNNQCNGKTCAADPTAECVFDTCGGCHARWYNGSNEVTHICEDIPPWKCKNNKLKVYCFGNPCDPQKTSCPGVPAAKCRADRCKECYARWYVGSLEVTDKCSNPNKCGVNSCKNGGICISLPETYQCLCMEGFSGPNCETSDKCFNNPCQNNGKCVSFPHTYVCQCPNGYTGRHCETVETPAHEKCRFGRLVQVNKCVGNCPEGFSCSSGLANTPGLCCLKQTQNLCDGALPYAINEDAPGCIGPVATPCPTNYTCVASQNPLTPVSVCCPKKKVLPPVSSYGTCINGEQRVSCNIDPCKNAVCPMTNAECVSDYCGGCYDRWYVGNTETTPFCEARANVCANGRQYHTCNVDPCGTATCRGVPNAICRTDACGGCFARWFVNSLEVTENCDNANKCEPNQCLNRGNCVSEKTTYRCICAEGYTGQNCQTRDYCSSNPCLNGAACVNKVGTYECTCRPGYTDALCSTKDNCYPNPCLNGGICTSEANTYACSCPTGYMGSECQTQTTRPEYLKCKYGRLVKNNDTVMCTLQNPYSCPPGFFCSAGPADQPGPCCLDERQNLCGADQPLRTDGDVDACWRDQQNYKKCSTGYVCKYSLDPNRRVSACCPEKKQEYPPSTCVNNKARVQCTRNPCDGVSCILPNAKCVPDYCGGCYDRWYEGTQEITAKCKSMVPGSCVNQQTRLYCTEDPCNSVCTGVPAAVCRSDLCGGCYARWFAGDLEVTDKCKNSNRCLPNDCKNGGTCISLHSTFICHCPPGFSGPKCETNYRCQANTCLNGGVCTDIAKSYKCTCKQGYTGERCQTSVLPAEHERCEYGKLKLNGNPLPCMPGIPNSCPTGFYCKGGAGVMSSQCCLKMESNICTGAEPHRVNGQAVSCDGSIATSCPADHTCTSNGDPQYSLSVCCPTPPTVTYPTTCLNNEIKTQCPTDPCQGATCPVPNVQCISDTCGGCHQRWFISKFEVTAFCKPNQLPGTCPNAKAYQSCPSTLCTTSSCPGVRDAVCRVDNCGGCYERFFLGSEEVTDKCSNPDMCQTNPCVNGGVCVSLQTTYKCVCKGNYVGTTCAEINHCGAITCLNGGSCVNLATAGKCNCPPGFYGDTCQHADACSPNPCLNGGSCVNHAASYKCTCMPEYDGPTCNIHKPTPLFKKCKYGKLSNGTSEVLCDPLTPNSCPTKFHCSAGPAYERGPCCLEPEDNLCGADIPFRVKGHAKSCGGLHGFKCPASYICKSSADPDRPISVCCPTKLPAQPKQSRLDCRYGTYYPDIITSPSCRQTSFSCPDGFKCRGGSSRRSGNCCLRQNPCAKSRPLTRSGDAFHCMGTGARACPANYECVGSIDSHSACCRLTTRTKCPRNRPDQNCKVNLCKIEYCPSVKGAQCLMNVCGKCEARWYFEGNDVTNECRKHKGCPVDKPKAPCTGNPCATATCPANKTAKCGTEYCGGTKCKAVFFDNLKEVQC